MAGHHRHIGNGAQEYADGEQHKKGHKGVRQHTPRVPLPRRHVQRLPQHLEVRMLCELVTLWASPGSWALGWLAEFDVGSCSYALGTNQTSRPEPFSEKLSASYRSHIYMPSTRDNIFRAPQHLDMCVPRRPVYSCRTARRITSALAWLAHSGVHAHSKVSGTLSRAKGRVADLSLL